MAKIKINGDSSGYVEIVAPNAAHNNTLELGPGTKILTDKNTHTSSIGIGTDNPTETLTLNHANGASIGLEYSGTENGTINVNSAAMYVRAGTGKHLILGSNGTEKLRIDSDGRLLANGAAATNAWTGGDDLIIGNTDSGTRTGITLVSHSGSDGGLYWSDGTGASVYRGQIAYNHASDTMTFYTAASSRLSINTNGHMRLSSGDLRVGDNTDSNAGSQTISVGSVSSGSGGIGIFANPTNGNSWVQFGDGTSGSDQYRGYMNYQHASDSLFFGTAGTTKLSIQSTGATLMHVNSASHETFRFTTQNVNEAKLIMRDASNNNDIVLNTGGDSWFNGGDFGIGTASPSSDGGRTLEIYDDNTPSIRLNDGNQYKALFQLRGNDLEIRGSNGQLEFYTGNADGASSSLRGAITSAGHKWTHNGSIFHGSNDVTDFTQSSRDTYNNVSLRSGHQSAGTSPANTNSAIKIYPAGVRSTQTGNLTGGIAWQHLDPNNGTWGSDFGSGSQIWMGAALHDTPGQERDRFNLWMNDQTSAGSNPNNLAIEAYPNGIVRHPKVPAFNAKGFSAHRDLSTWHNVDLNNWISVDQNGSHYNNSNGRFTAPVPGKYFFIYTSMFHNPQTADFHNNITKNGTVVVYSNNHSGGGNANGHQWNDCTVQIVITLAAGDYVTARSTGGNNNTTYLYGSGASNYSTFCGFLIG